MFTQDYGCDASKIHVIPNGVRSENLLANPSIKAATMPRDTADLERPVAGVIGNLGANTDWVMVEEAVKRTPWLSWLFVGPYTDVIKTPEQAQARMRLLKSEQDRLRFVGRKDAGALRDYARGVDVAVLPYRKVEPTFSGSSTRFYEHLAAGRPMISTRGFEELLHKEPLLKLVDNADELVDALTRLRSSGFQDGLGRMRWEASRRETWDVRAREMVERIARLALPAGVGIERCRP
jgi:glycosyltransferase involved in cell wall biosynthesis